jgi:hypothetical protein
MLFALLDTRLQEEISLSWDVVLEDLGVPRDLAQRQYRGINLTRVRLVTALFKLEVHR